jgi:hypothetical protein
VALDEVGVGVSQVTQLPDNYFGSWNTPRDPLAVLGRYEHV